MDLIHLQDITVWSLLTFVFVFIISFIGLFFIVDLVPEKMNTYRSIHDSHAFEDSCAAFELGIFRCQMLAVLIITLTLTFVDYTEFSIGLIILILISLGLLAKAIHGQLEYNDYLSERYLKQVKEFEEAEEKWVERGKPILHNPTKTASNFEASGRPFRNSYSNNNNIPKEVPKEPHNKTSEARHKWLEFCYENATVMYYLDINELPHPWVIGFWEPATPELKERYYRMKLERAISYTKHDIKHIKELLFEDKEGPLSNKRRVGLEEALIEDEKTLDKYINELEFMCMTEAE